MKLEHIALSISDSEEIKKFYHDILGMNQLRTFNLSKVLANDIFGIDKEPSVYLLQKDELLVEIFVTTKQYKQGFKHICILIKNREELIKKAAQNSYKCIHIKRKKSDLIFIKDKSGNIFEIKESNTEEHSFAQ
ncbi:MAG: VOC family protein [Bacteroidales bacterium]|nr:VOC family protein [Bacteroidales bacterium]